MLSGCEIKLPLQLSCFPKMEFFHTCTDWHEITLHCTYAALVLWFVTRGRNAVITRFIDDVCPHKALMFPHLAALAWSYVTSILYICNAGVCSSRQKSAFIGCLFLTRTARAPNDGLLLTYLHIHIPGLTLACTMLTNTT